MITLRIIILLFIIAVNLFFLMSQTTYKASGKWLGTLVVNESVQLRLGIEIFENDQAEPISVIHSLDQAAFDIPIKTTVLNSDSIFLNIVVMGGRYEDKFTDSENIVGNF